MAIQRIKEVSTQGSLDQAQIRGWGLDILSNYTITGDGHSNSYYVAGSSEVIALIYIGGPIVSNVVFTLSTEFVNTVFTSSPNDLGPVTQNSVTITQPGSYFVKIQNISDYATISWTPTGNVSGVYLRFIAKSASDDTTIIGPFGQASSANSIPVVVASNQATYSTVGNYQLTISGTPTQLSSATTQYIVVKNQAGSSSSVFIGNSSVSVSNGLELVPGQPFGMPVANPNVFYVVSSGSATIDVMTYN